MFLIFLYLICTVSGILLVKLGGKGTEINISSGIMHMNINLLILLGLLLYLVSFLLWIVILKRNELSYIIALTTGISYLLIMISSVAFLNEKFTFYKIVGAVIILIGVMFINIGK